jgi:hypothetical protein
MTIRNPKDFWSGIIFLTVGLATVLLIRKLPIGTSMHMGPAYFPTVLGTLLGLIGLAVMIRSLIAPGEAIGKLSYKNLFLVLGSIVLFAMLLRPAGLVITLMLLVFISAYASPKFTWVKSSILAFGLTAFCVIVFVIALGLPIPILGGFFGG